MTTTLNRFRILAIPGSLRRNSNSLRLLGILIDLAPEDVEVQIQTSLFDIPHYNEELREAGDPEPVRALKAAISAADALLFATPEYNASVPGAIKDLVDWASPPRGASVLDGKRAAVISYSPGSQGGQRAHAHLRAVLTAAGADALLSPAIMIGHVEDRLPSAGRGPDPEVAELLQSAVSWLRGPAAGPALKAVPQGVVV